METSELELKGKKYVPFEIILKKSTCSQPKDIKKCRNACMHKDIWEKPFSKVSEPLRAVYLKIESMEKNKRDSQRDVGKRKNLSKKWKKSK